MAESLALRFSSDLSGNSAFTIYYNNWTMSSNVISVPIPANWQAVCFIVNTMANGAWVFGAAVLVTTMTPVNTQIRYHYASGTSSYQFEFNTWLLKPGTAGNMGLSCQAYVVTGAYFAF